MHPHYGLEPLMGEGLNVLWLHNDYSSVKLGSDADFQASLYNLFEITYSNGVYTQLNL